ncbi:hypothetical protein ACQ5SO_13400 [Rhodovulum sp. DZ06]|uniref:hypothetical protein n=1 Tax=Rhodovulum sp. DZ06 TaxID=3425126 RepID=UPI003D32733A
MDPARRAALGAKRAAAGQAREAARDAQALRLPVFLSEALGPAVRPIPPAEVRALWQALGDRAGFGTHGLCFVPPEAPGALVQRDGESRAAFLARIAPLVAGEPPCAVIEDLRDAGLRCAPETALGEFDTLWRELPGHIAIIGAGMRWALLVRGTLPVEFVRLDPPAAGAGAQGGEAPHSRPQGG